MDAPVTRVSKDYEAIGDASGIHPFIYGKHTLIEFKSPPFGLTVKDEHGIAVGYTKEGRYYSLDRKLDYFTLSAGGREIAFSIAPQEEPPLGPLVDPQEMASTETAAIASPVQLQAHERQRSIQDDPIFRAMRDQLKQYRQFLQKAESSEKITGDELESLSKKLDGLDKKMANGVAIVHVHFSNHAVNPPINDNTLMIALDAAKHADRINIYGRTSAVVAGKKDARIARNRAANIKKFLVDNGIKEYRINVSSLAEGDFIVSPKLKGADALNRRAAIELIRDL